MPMKSCREYFHEAYEIDCVEAAGQAQSPCFDTHVPIAGKRPTRRMRLVPRINL